MAYEKELPDYAMLPAKEMEERVIVPISKGAIYENIEISNITEKPKTIITIEEDLLVPDTKPDLREILMIDGKPVLTTKEIEKVSKNDDYINLSGEIELQMLYSPEKREKVGPIIAVQTRVPFKDQWHTELTEGANMTMDAKIEKIDYMVINERKYRVKIVLAIMAKECVNSKIDVFEGVSGEELQMLKEDLEITNISMRKKDVLKIEEILEIEEELPVENILKQDITVVENHKQISDEKIVVNGAIYVNILYQTMDNLAMDNLDISTDTENSSEPKKENVDYIKQAQAKVEFSEFIPLTDAGDFESCNISFDGSGLKVKVAQDEELGEVFLLDGELVTYVELYKSIQKEIIIDGYHREKDFVCDFDEKTTRTIIGTAVGENSVREIISPEVQSDIEKIIYTTAEIKDSEAKSEKGKIITEGTILTKMICQGVEKEGESIPIFSVSEEVPFRVVTTSNQANGDEIVNDKIYLKDVWAEKINQKQIEFNASVLANSELAKETPFKLLVNPAFEESTVKTSGGSMAVYVAKEGDNLWNVAKKFKTTMSDVSELNKIEDNNIAVGQKLLIIK